MKKIFFILSILLISILSHAELPNNNQYWKKANIAYQQKQFDSAIFYYGKVLKIQMHNSIVHYNLGNAYYKSNKVSQAVLCYERALFYQPNFGEAKDNLRLAKSRIPNSIKELPDIFFVQWWKGITSVNTTNIWAGLSVALFLLLLGIIFYSIYTKQQNRIPVQIYFIFPFIIVFFLFLSFTAVQRKTKCTLAVVMNQAAVLVKEPNNYKGQSIVPEATTVTTEEIKGNWVSVTLPNNKTGWMQIAELKFVYQPTKTK